MSTQDEAIASAQRRDIELYNGYVDEDGDIHTEVSLREMLHPEEKLLGSKKPDIEKVLQNCLVRVGTITDPKTIREKVYPRILKGDGDHLMIELRKLSLHNGNLYKFDFICPAPDCKREDRHEYDLDALEFLHVDSAEEDKGKREFEFDVNGKSCVFRHYQMSDTKMVAEINKSEEDVIAKGLALRLISIDGETPEEVNPKAKTEKARLMTALKMLQRSVPSYKERERIRMVLRDKQARPDLVIQTTCEFCGTTFRKQMAVNPTFLRPSLEE